MFGFVSLESKENLQRCGDVFFDILITNKGASALGSFRNFYRSLNKTDVRCTKKKLQRRRRGKRRGK